MCSSHKYSSAHTEMAKLPFPLGADDLDSRPNEENRESDHFSWEQTVDGGQGISPRISIVFNTRYTMHEPTSMYWCQLPLQFSTEEDIFIFFDGVVRCLTPLLSFWRDGACRADFYWRDVVRFLQVYIMWCVVFLWCCLYWMIFPMSSIPASQMQSQYTEDKQVRNSKLESEIYFNVSRRKSKMHYHYYRTIKIVFDLYANLWSDRFLARMVSTPLNKLNCARSYSDTK